MTAENNSQPINSLDITESNKEGNILYLKMKKIII